MLGSADLTDRNQKHQKGETSLYQRAPLFWWNIGSWVLAIHSSSISSDRLNVIWNVTKGAEFGSRVRGKVLSSSSFLSSADVPLALP